MALSSQPVTLSPEQLDDLNRKLSTMRHDINNNLSLILAALELLRAKPEMTQRMVQTMMEQPGKILAAVNDFSAELQHALCNPPPP